MKHLLQILAVAAAVFLLAAFTGCARFSSTVSQTDERGVKTTTTVKVLTFWDSHNDISKYLAHQTVRTNGVAAQSIGFGSVDQSASGTNAVDLLKAASEGLAAGILKGVK